MMNIRIRWIINRIHRIKRQGHEKYKEHPDFPAHTENNKLKQFPLAIENYFLTETNLTDV